MAEAVDAVLLLGPTASGKSALAIQLAAEIPLEIVSVDSAQVYRGMDIGTAKPSTAERAAVPHHLIDIRDPAEPYSAADFDPCSPSDSGTTSAPVAAAASVSASASASASRAK